MAQTNNRHVPSCWENYSPNSIQKGGGGKKEAEVYDVAYMHTMSSFRGTPPPPPAEHYCIYLLLCTPGNAMELVTLIQEDLKQIYNHTDTSFS
jgi:hypothetical protein